MKKVTKTIASFWSKVMNNNMSAVDALLFLGILLAASGVIIIILDNTIRKY
jgi:hypothetical protein